LSAWGQDPLPQEWCDWINNCQKLRDQGDLTGALELVLRATRSRPEEYVGHYFQAGILQQMSRNDSSLECSTRAVQALKAGRSQLAANRADVQAAVYSDRAKAYLIFGELAKAKQDANEAVRLKPDLSVTQETLGRLLMNAGDMDGAIECFERSEKLQVAEEHGSFTDWEFLGNLGHARRMKGDYAGATAVFQRIIQIKTGRNAQLAPSVGHAGLALLYALAEDEKVRDLAKARTAQDTAERASPPGFISENVVEAGAIIALLEGKPEAAVDWFDRLSQLLWRAEDLYYYGLAELRVGARDRAIHLLVRAADQHPGFRKKIETDPEFAPVRQTVVAALRELGDKSPEDRIAVKRELERSPITLAYIDGLARVKNYKAALASLDVFLKETQSETLRKSASDRKAKLKDQAALFQRLVKAIQERKLDDSKSRDEGTPRLGNVTEETVELKLKDGGAATGPWGIVSFDAYLNLLNGLSLNDVELFTVGALCLDNDRPAQAEGFFCKCLSKGGKDLKSRVDELVAAQRGVPVPSGGFVASGNRLVTAEERDNLAKGLALFRGKWVPKEDKPHLEKGHEKVGGKWVSLSEGQLKARGFVKYGDEWRTKEDVARLRGDWTNAWTTETEHYEIRTNKSEACMKRLAAALEEAYQAYAAFFGSAPKNAKKMKVFAFAKFDDYRAYCEKLHQTDKFNATGFAPSEPGTLCGYDKFNDDRSFTSTIVHEGCHLFYQLSFPSSRPPSWIAEGMATNFEGFTEGADGHLRWDFLARDRWAQAKEAARRQALVPLDEFLKGEAGKLIASDPQRALTFYAEAWLVFYFMQKAPDARYRDGFKAFMEATERGGKADLKEALGPLYDSLQRDFVQFVEGL
jgi:tetratricopeptide (TPR) repeat protein